MDCDTTGLSADKKARIIMLDARTALLESDRRALSVREGRLRAGLAESGFDGSRLEHVSLTTLFYRLKSRQPEEVRVRAEQFAMWLEFSQVQSELSDADALLRELSDERERLRGAEDAAGRDKAAQHEAVALAQCRMEALETALAAGHEAGHCLNSVEEDLLKVEELGEASGGMLSSAVMIEYVHAAREQAGRAQRLMQRFRYALAGEDWCATDALTGFADCFLRCLVTDFIPRGRVHESLSCVRDAQDRLSLITSKLDAAAEAQREALYAVHQRSGKNPAGLKK
jgi:hypothetical protein